MSNQETRIVSKNSYRYWGLLENLITTLTPILYIFFNYQLYKKMSGKVTYWVWIIIFIVIGFAKRFIINFVLDLRKNQSEFAKRGMRIMIIVLISMLILFSYQFVKDLIVLALVYSGGLLLSMYPYYHYTKNKAFYEKVIDVKENEDIKDDLRSGKLKIK